MAIGKRMYDSYDREKKLSDAIKKYRHERRKEQINNYRMIAGRNCYVKRLRNDDRVQ